MHVYAVLVLQRLKHHGLTERDVNRIVSDEHLEVISRTCCEQWKSLPPHLGLDTIVANDIDTDGTLRGYRAKRLEFFHTWKEVKGHNATYKQLITALLKIDCGDDADAVCALLTDEQPPPLTPGVPSHSLVPPTRPLAPPTRPLAPPTRSQSPPTSPCTG